MLVYAAQSAWRAYRAASRRATDLSRYADEQARELERLANRLNQNGFALQHSAAELFPKLQGLAAFLERPLVAAAIPWLLRRALRRPYRRR
jgi:hypothetical protein